MSQLAALPVIQPFDINASGAYAWRHNYTPDLQPGNSIATHRIMLPSQNVPTPPVQQKRRGRPRKDVEKSKEKAAEPTPKFQIVMQSQPGEGSKQDSLRMIRRHAMLAVRKQQREKRKAALNERLPTILSREENTIQATTQADQQPLVISRRNSIPSPTSPPMGWTGTPQEVRAMTYFREKAVFSLSGWRDAKLWPQIVQRSQTVPELRHALIALAVMHETLCASETFVPQRLSVADESMFAIQSYHKSLASLRNSISSASYATVLMSSILISAFQAFDNDPACFLTWKSGLALYDQFSGHSQISSSPGATVEDRYFVDTEIAPMFQMYRDRCCNFYDQQYGLKIAITRGRYPPTAKPHIPSLFSTLWQARDILAEIFNWACGCIQIPIVSPALDPSVALEFTTMLHLWSMALEATTSRLVRLPIVGELEEDEFSRTKGRLAAARLLGEILIGTVGSDRESDMDPYDGHFEKIVRIYQQVEPQEIAQRQYFSFGIQSGVLETMIFVALRCRDPRIRRQAVDVLRCGARFEGPFNGVQNCTILDAVIQQEEAGLRSVICSRDVPESSRIRFQSIEIFPMIEKIRFRFTHSPYLDLGAQVEERIVSMPPRCGLKVRRYVVEPVDLDNSLVPAAFMGRGSSSFPLMNNSQYFVTHTEGFDFPVPRV